MDRRTALITAGRTRLRPILMTTSAMVFGMLPLFLAIGEGAEFRAPMARAVVGGLITSTLLTLVVIPTLAVWGGAGAALVLSILAMAGALVLALLALANAGSAPVAVDIRRDGVDLGLADGRQLGRRFIRDGDGAEVRQFVFQRRTELLVCAQAPAFA